MGLLSFLKRPSGDAPKAAPSKAAPSKDPVDAVQQARTRARQRLIGAAVLVVAGVIGFPMIFATQPRPLPVDTPIDIARRDASVSVASSDRAPAATGGQGAVVNESAADAGREVTPSPRPRRPRKLPPRSPSRRRSRSPSAAPSRRSPHRSRSRNPLKSRRRNPPSASLQTSPPTSPSPRPTPTAPRPCSTDRTRRSAPRAASPPRNRLAASSCRWAPSRR